MIALSTKGKTASASPLSLAPNEEKPTLSFSELFKGVKSGKETKEAQNGVVVLALKDSKNAVNTPTSSTPTLSTKQESSKDKRAQMLESLLKGESVSQESVSVKEESDVVLNPKLTQNLSVQEIKTLVADAKEYLKEKIMQSDGYKKAQVKELPTTLKGLARMAKEFGVELQKITLQEVASKSSKSSAEVVVQEQTPSDSHAIDEKKTQTSATSVPHAMKKSKKTAPEQTTLQQDATQQKEQVQENKEVQEKSQTSSKDLKATPIFKAQTQEQATTEQLVMLKQFKPQEPTQKERANDTLKLLLRGEEKSATASANLTQDFSVATARVIAPSAQTDGQKNLESLLRGESATQENGELGLKSENATTLKADSFEVKINEAKQLTKYLSADVKNAIDEYKSPFTRVKLQLNPQRLGEIDLTIVQRGKNLHVNLSSNNAAINALAMNATDLRTQLQNSGINNATLNFSNTSDNASAQGQTGGQQHQQQGQRAHQEYNYFATEAENEEILSSLEIIVPRYI